MWKKKKRKTSQICQAQAHFVCVSILQGRWSHGRCWKADDQKKGRCSLLVSGSSVSPSAGGWGGARGPISVAYLWTLNSPVVLSMPPGASGTLETALPKASGCLERVQGLPASMPFICQQTNQSRAHPHKGLLRTSVHLGFTSTIPLTPHPRAMHLTVRYSPPAPEPAAIIPSSQS